MINYTWTIESVECIVSKDGLNNVIQTVYYRYMGINEKDTVYEITGAHVLDLIPSDCFIEIEDINSKIVIGWLEKYINVD